MSMQEWKIAIWSLLVTGSWLCIYVLVATMTTGCGMLLGVKSYQSGDTRIEFVTGFNTEVSAAGTDTLDNNRAIRPSGGYVNKAKD